MSMSSVRVLIADDHRIVAEGLRCLLESRYEVIDIVPNGQDLVATTCKARPDVILVDITMPRLNGLEAVGQLRGQGYGGKVIFLTMHRDATYAARALQLGASGFVLKHSAGDELVTAIEAALRGESFLSPEIAAAAERWEGREKLLEKGTTLTSRQRQVLQLFAEGNSAKEVGVALGISTRTAENHKARIMDQLKLRSIPDLVQYALRHGIISND
jgi:DNA-binding NarL/FixJ family response regulator